MDRWNPHKLYQLLCSERRSSSKGQRWQDRPGKGQEDLEYSQQRPIRNKEVIDRSWKLPENQLIRWFIYLGIRNIIIFLTDKKRKKNTYFGTNGIALVISGVHYKSGKDGYPFDDNHAQTRKRYCPTTSGKYRFSHTFSYSLKKWYSLVRFFQIRHREESLQGHLTDTKSV